MCMYINIPIVTWKVADEEHYYSVRHYQLMESSVELSVR